MMVCLRGGEKIKDVKASAVDGKVSGDYGSRVPKTDDVSESVYPSPKEMQGWLEREITDVMKAMELRIREATRFVGAYARSEITSEEAAKLGYEYQCRWGDPLPGVHRSRGASDEQILDRISGTRAKQGLAERYSGNRGGGRSGLR